MSKEMSYFINKHLVTLKPSKTGCFGLFSLPINHLHAECYQIKQYLALVTNYNAGAARGTLKIIRVQADGDRFVFQCEIHQNFSCILHIDFKVAKVTSDGEHAARQTKQPKKIIHFMNLRKNYTASQIQPGGIHLAVILICMPSGQ